MKFTSQVILVFLFSGCIDCSVIPHNNNGARLRRLETEPETVQVLRPRRDAKPETDAQHQRYLVGLRPTGGSEFNGAPVDNPLDPVYAVVDTLMGNAKEKRCRQRFEPTNPLGSAYRDPNDLNIVRREVPFETMPNKRCEICMNNPRCKNLGKCDMCALACKSLTTLPTIKEREAAFSEDMGDFRHGDPTMVSMSNRQMEIPDEHGLSEADDRFYTVGSFGPGPTQSLLARLLQINDRASLERLIVLAKTRSATKPHTVDHPVVIDTAHIFTLNDGEPTAVDLELHPVHQIDRDVADLTRKLNKDLDNAIEHKKKLVGDSHLTALEIDKIIDHALQTNPERPSSEMVASAAEPNQDHPEEVGCKKKKKDKDSEEEYAQPINYGGYYREADSDEEDGAEVKRNGLDDAPKSISSRTRESDDGVNSDLVEEPLADETENGERVPKHKKGKGKKGKKHLVDNEQDGDVVGAEHEVETPEILHVENPKGNSESIQSDSHIAHGHEGSDKNVEPKSIVEQEKLPEHGVNSKESVEINDKERHKKKKKGKKGKGGGHDYGYGGYYRDAAENDFETDTSGQSVGDSHIADDPQVGGINTEARSNYEEAMEQQHYPDPHPQEMHTHYQPETQQYEPQPPMDQPHPQQYQPQPQQYQQHPQQYQLQDQNYQPQPHQYQQEPQYSQTPEQQQYQPETPSLPNSYQPEGYQQQDNYQSQENYYDDSSEEYEPESYVPDSDGYEEEGEGYEQQPPSDYETPHEEYQAPEQYHPHLQTPQEAYQQQPQSQAAYAPPQQEYQQPPPEYQPKPQIYQPKPQEQHPVYSHPPPPVEQGTYVPKKPQYNEDPKLLPTSPEEQQQYPINEPQQEIQYGEQEEEEGYEQEEHEGYGDASPQSIVIPGVDIDEDYVLGQASKSKDPIVAVGKGDGPTGTNKALVNEFTNIIRNDLTQGVKLANMTAQDLNRRIAKLIEDNLKSGNLAEKLNAAKLNTIENAIDNVDDAAKDTIVGDNLKVFRTRFQSPERGNVDNIAESINPTDSNPTVAAVLDNEHGILIAKKMPLNKPPYDSKHITEQVMEPIIGMANIPSESKTPPFIDPKVVNRHQLALTSMMRGDTPERVAGKENYESDEGYFPMSSAKHYRDSGKVDENQQGLVTNEEIEKKVTNIDDDEGTLGCKKKKKKKDKESKEEYIMVYPPPQSYGGDYRENEDGADRTHTGDVEHEHVADDADDTVGCKKKKKDKKDKESKEYIMVYPPKPQYHDYGGYRENNEGADRRTGTVTNDAIEEHVGIADPNESLQPGPSGPFTDEPVEGGVGADGDDTVGCKKKHKKDKESEEHINIYPIKPQYNEYGGYRANEEDADKKPIKKITDAIDKVVDGGKENMAKAEKAAQDIVVKNNKEATEIPKGLLPQIIQGVKELRNHRAQQVANLLNLKDKDIVEPLKVSPETRKIEATLEAPIQKIENTNASPQNQLPIINPQFRPNRPSVPPPNEPMMQPQQFMPPPTNPNFMRSPIDENLATLEAFHHQQQQQVQPWFPTMNDRVGAPQSLVDNRGSNHFGQVVPADANNPLNIENREVNEKTQMFFVGDGIKLPIHVKKLKDGTMHLSIDVGKLCNCKNETCTHAVEGLANLVPTLEKLNHGTVELEVNEDSFNNALNNLNNFEESSHDNRQDGTDKSKRSPAKQHNEEDESDSGELVPVFDNDVDNEEYDEISPIKKYYRGDLANDLYNLKDNIQKYYDNEDQFKAYISEHPRNNGFVDEFINRRVGLLTNVLSWMKSIAIDEAREQHSRDY